MRYSFCLTEPQTNNEAEYEALIAGLEIAVNIKIQNFQIFDNSQPVINQVLGIYKICKVELTHYHRRALELLKQLLNVNITRIPRGQNAKADCLAKLAKVVANSGEEMSIWIDVYNRRVLELAILQFSQAEGIPDSSQQDTTSVEPKSPQQIIIEDPPGEYQLVKRRRKASIASESWCYCLDVEEDDWRQPFIDYFRESKLPTDKSLAAQIKKRAL